MKILKKLRNSVAIRTICLVAFLVLLNSTFVFADEVAVDQEVVNKTEELITKIFNVIAYGIGGFLTGMGVLELWGSRSSQNPETRKQGTEHAISGIGWMFIAKGVEAYIIFLIQHFS